VDEVSVEHLGTALHTLVQELAAERRLIALLERENRELKAQIEAIEKLVASETPARPMPLRLREFA
jgi:hypothetical protein